MFDAYTSQVLTSIGINSLLALSLYITALAGQSSVGHAAFMGIGAYAFTLLMTKLGWPFSLSARCGALGIFNVPKATDNWIVYISLGVFLLFFHRLKDSRLGRAFRAVEENEEAARARG